MRYFIRALLFIIILAVLGLLGMAIFSDLPPSRETVTVPVDPK